jgi:hypothetical protein
MVQIAPSSKQRCVQRGISTMRLALGYKTGLPKDWWYKPEGGTGSWYMTDEIRQILESFPRHKVIIYWFDSKVARECGEYGLPVKDGDVLFTIGEQWHDEHLLGFSYRHAYDACHFVVGSPTDDMHIMYLVAVSLNKTGT